MSSEDVRLADLREDFPEAATAELRRFCRARPNSSSEAAEMYRRHLLWRQGTGAKDNLLKAALDIPPKYIRPAGHALDGTPILFVQGALYDPEIDPEKYMLACGHALDTMLSADDDRKVTILIDARPGEDWPNVSAHKMMPFFRLATSALPENYPERVQRIVIYPVPWAVGQLWQMVRRLLDPVTRAKVEVYSGSGAHGAPCPPELSEIVSLDQLPMDAQKTHHNLEQEEEEASADTTPSTPSVRENAGMVQPNCGSAVVSGWACCRRKRKSA